MYNSGTLLISYVHCTTQEQSQLQDHHVYCSYLRRWTVSTFSVQQRITVCRIIMCIHHTSNSTVSNWSV